MEMQTALQWATQHMGHNKFFIMFINWLLQQDYGITMPEVYRLCPNVSWAWDMLRCCCDARHKHMTKTRKRQLARAMKAFSKEFCEAARPSWHVLDPTSFMSNASWFLTQEKLSFWADRLREYVVPAVPAAREL
jgi:hypothetical protein